MRIQLRLNGKIPDLPTVKPQILEFNISEPTATASTLFTRTATRGIMANILNRELGTELFTPDNIMKYAGYFSAKELK